MQQTHSSSENQGISSRIWQSMQGAYHRVQTSAYSVLSSINPLSQARKYFTFYNTPQAQMRAPLPRNRLAEIAQYLFPLNTDTSRVTSLKTPEPIIIDIETHLKDWALPPLDLQASIETQIQTCIEVANTQRQSLEDLKRSPSPIEGFNAQIDSVQKRIATLQEKLTQSLSRQEVEQIYQSLGHIQSGISVNQLCQATTEKTNITEFIQQKIAHSQQKQGKALSQLLAISYQRPRILKNMQIIWPSFYQWGSFFKPFQTILNQIETAHQAETGHPLEKSTPIANSRFLEHFLNSINTKNISVKEHDYSPNSQTLQNFIPRISELLTEREWRTLDSNMPKETQEALAILERLFSGEHLNIQETDSLEALIPHLAQLETALTHFSSHHPSHTYGFFNYYIKNTVAVHVWQQKALPSMQKGQELLHWVSGLKNACAQMQKAKETIEALAPKLPNTTLPKTQQPNTTLSPQAYQEFLTQIRPLKPHLSSPHDAFSHLMAPITQQQTLIQHQTMLNQLGEEIHQLVEQGKGNSPEEAISLQKQLAARLLWLSAADIVSDDTRHLARDTRSSLKILDTFAKVSKQSVAVSKQLTASPFSPQALSPKAENRAIAAIAKANTYKGALPVFECVQTTPQNETSSEASGQESTANPSTARDDSANPTLVRNTHSNIFHCLSAAQILNGFKIAATQMVSCFSLGCGKNAMQMQYPPTTNQNANLKKQQKEQAQKTFQLINQAMFGDQNPKEMSSTGNHFYQMMQDVSCELRKISDTPLEWDRENPYIEHFNKQFLASAQNAGVKNIAVFKAIATQIEQGNIPKAVKHLRDILKISMLIQDKAQRPVLCSLIRNTAEQLNGIAFYQMHLSISKELARTVTSTKNQLTPTQQETILANVQMYTQTLRELTKYATLADEYLPTERTNNRKNATSEYRSHLLNQYKSFLHRATLLSPETIAQEIYRSMMLEKKEPKAANTEHKTTDSSDSAPQTDSASKTTESPKTAAPTTESNEPVPDNHLTRFEVSSDANRCWLRAVWFNILLETPASDFLNVVTNIHQRYRNSGNAHLPTQECNSFFRENNFPQRMRAAYPRMIQQMRDHLEHHTVVRFDHDIEVALCDFSNFILRPTQAGMINQGTQGDITQMGHIAAQFPVSTFYRLPMGGLVPLSEHQSETRAQPIPENNQIVIKGGNVVGGHFEIFVNQAGREGIMQKLREKRLS